MIVVVEIFSVVDHVMYSLCVKTLLHLGESPEYSNYTSPKLNTQVPFKYKTQWENT